MDKQEYFERLDNLIKSGPYEKVIRNPLPRMLMLKKCKNLISDSIKFKLNESKLPNYPNAEIAILGDFNVHNINWLKYSNTTGERRREADAFSIS